MEHKPTKEQERIYHFVTKRPENLLIEARAGAGKTTVLTEILKLLPVDKDITFLAFNKHIAEELKDRIPQHVRCYTSHGLGLGAIKRKYGKNIEFDEFKADHIIQKKAKSWHLNGEFDDELAILNYLGNLKKMVNLCKLTLTTDSKYYQYISDRYDIPYNDATDNRRVSMIMETMMNDKHTYDFTDMVFLPAIDKNIWLFPQDYVLVDEAQDMNMAQQKMVEKMLKRDKATGRVTGKLIVVGDVFQSIYGFTGVTEKTFEWFRDFPNMKPLPLATTFRCAKNIVLEANRLVPDLKALDDAPDGVVRDGSALNEAQSGDFILCRTTMPLVKLFFHFLLQQKKAIIKGSDIGLSLIEMIGEVKTMDELKKFWNKELDKFRGEIRKKGIIDINEHSGYMAMEDKVNTLLFLTRIATSIPDLKQKIGEIFTDEIKGIVLSTVHKAKGLEADRVFIVRPDLLPMRVRKAWQVAQERNLEYVAITRSRLELIYDREWSDEN
jgi:DNA helicase-2/ATP-dependent DNA helicase PcrA